MALLKTPPTVARGPIQKPIESILGEKITVMPNGCWAFKGSLTRRAHTSSRAGGVMVYRFVYETLVGPIPEGHVLHHHCENPGCCNPKHLEPMTNGDHIRHHAALRRAA